MHMHFWYGLVVGLLLYWAYTKVMAKKSMGG